MSRQYFQGKEAEQEFESLFSSTRSTKREDMYEHWDLRTSWGKVDVKAMKSIKRGQPVQDDFIWVELKNVRGSPGWLYGQADYFAFQCLDRWLICPKLALQELVESLVTDENCYPPVCCIYQRKGRQDEVTLIPQDKIKLISYEIKRVNESKG